MRGEGEGGRKTGEERRKEAMGERAGGRTGEKGNNMSVKEKRQKRR